TANVRLRKSFFICTFPPTYRFSLLILFCLSTTLTTFLRYYTTNHIKFEPPALIISNAFENALKNVFEKIA
ncbi:MAG TPA: hypothetical protein PLK18_05290, partial [Fervidobacterium sp.]|nr:hypothetical protein [Fervidobacterium sp.]